MESKKDISRVVGGLRGEIEIPGDKSVSHRSVMLAGLCDTPVHITNFLHAADCLSTAAAMEALGVSVRWSDETTLDVTGRGFDVPFDIHRRRGALSPPDGPRNHASFANGRANRRQGRRKIFADYGFAR